MSTSGLSFSEADANRARYCDRVLSAFRAHRIRVRSAKPSRRRPSPAATKAPRRGRGSNMPRCAQLYIEFQTRSGVRSYSSNDTLRSISSISSAEAYNKSKQICKRHKKRRDICHRRRGEHFPCSRTLIVIQHTCLIDNLQCPVARVELNGKGYKLEYGNKCIEQQSDCDKRLKAENIPEYRKRKSESRAYIADGNNRISDFIGA